MSEEKQHSRDRRADFFSDETIRRFLLGCLPLDERARFEERLLLDDELEQRVRLIEYELTDDCAFGRLRREEREPFTQNFLVTEERQQKLAVSKSLSQELSQRTAEAFNDIRLEVELPALITEETQSKQSEAPWRLLIPSLFRFARPVVGFGLALVALLIFGGLVWLVMKSPPSKTQPAVATRPPVPGATKYAHAPSQTPESTISPFTPPPSEMPGKPGSGAPITTFVLPQTQQDGGEMIRITIPPGANDIVRLELLFASAEVATYRVELLTAEGQSVTVVPEAKVSSSNVQAKVVLDVPAPLLKVGDYQIKLSRTVGESVEDVERYYFRALEQQ